MTATTANEKFIARPYTPFHTITDTAHLLNSVILSRRRPFVLYMNISIYSRQTKQRRRRGRRREGENTTKCFPLLCDRQFHSYKCIALVHRINNFRIFFFFNFNLPFSVFHYFHLLPVHPLGMILDERPKHKSEKKTNKNWAKMNFCQTNFYHRTKGISEFPEKFNSNRDESKNED